MMVVSSSSELPSLTLGDSVWDLVPEGPSFVVCLEQTLGFHLKF